MARPSEFDQEIADRLCEWLAEGKSLNKFCAIEGNPAQTTIRRWRESNPEFRSQYAQARIDQYYVYADQIIDISDKEDGDVMRDRLRVDSRKWLLSKRIPHEFGDRVSEASQKPEPKKLIFNRGETRKSKRAVKAKAAK